MRRSTLVVGLCLAAAVMLWAQSGRYMQPPPYEMKVLYPRETSPGKFEHVTPMALQTAANDGWELVSVTPYVYMNEERGTEAPKAIVTQTYSAFFFKRLRLAGAP